MGCGLRRGLAPFIQFDRGQGFQPDVSRERASINAITIEMGLAYNQVILLYSAPSEFASTVLTSSAVG